MTAEPLPRPAPPDSHTQASPARRSRTGDEIVPEDEPHRDMTLYSQFISDGIAAAERRGGAIAHLTARRMSLMLLSETNDPKFANGLTRFATDGAITEELRQSLRRYARRPGHSHHSYSLALLQYAAARETDPGPLGVNFSAACDQSDRGDAARIANPPDRQPGAGERAIEGPEPSYPRPSKRRALYAVGQHSLEILTAEEWAQIEAENLEDNLEEYTVHQWERDHEIE
jgi:hypothetical protein